MLFLLPWIYLILIEQWIKLGMGGWVGIFVNQEWIYPKYQLFYQFNACVVCIPVMAWPVYKQFGIYVDFNMHKMCYVDEPLITNESQEMKLNFIYYQLFVCYLSKSNSIIIKFCTNSNSVLMNESTNLLTNHRCLHASCGVTGMQTVDNVWYILSSHVFHHSFKFCNSMISTVIQWLFWFLKHLHLGHGVTGIQTTVFEDCIQIINIIP